MDWPLPPMQCGPHFGPSDSFPPPWRPMWRGRGAPHPSFMPYVPRFRNGPPAMPLWAMHQAESFRNDPPPREEWALRQAESFRNDPPTREEWALRQAERLRNDPPPKEEWALRQALRIRAWRKAVQAEQLAAETPEEDLGPAEHNNEQPRAKSGEKQDGAGQGAKRAQDTPEEGSSKRGYNNNKKRRNMLRQQKYIELKRQKRLEENNGEEEACMAPSSDHDDNL